MSKNFVLRAAVCVVALVCASVVLEGQASAKLFGGRHHGGGGGEGSCGCAAEEPSCGCAAEPSCGCCSARREPSCAAEPSCGCAAEPSCGCSAEPSCGCSSGHGRLRGCSVIRHRGGGLRLRSELRRSRRMRLRRSGCCRSRRWRDAAGSGSPCHLMAGRTRVCRFDALATITCPAPGDEAGPGHGPVDGRRRRPETPARIQLADCPGDFSIFRETHRGWESPAKTTTSKWPGLSERGPASFFGASSRARRPC